MPHIAYHEQYAKDLRYQFPDVSLVHLETVDEPNDRGIYVSLAIDATGVAHISYFDATSGDLKYARGIPPTMLYLVVERCQVPASFQMAWTSWSADAFWIYAAPNQWHFPPGLAPDFTYRIAAVTGGETSWTPPVNPGNVNENWSFQVIAVDASEQEITRSNRAGEFEIAFDIP